MVILFHGGKKRYVKTHFAVDVKTREVVTMYVTSDDIHDSEVLPSIMADASRHRLIPEACMDGAYDSIKSYRLLKRAGIKPIIKPRKNARTERGPPERRNSVMMLKTIGEEEWSRATGYGRRWRQHSQHSNAYTENTAWLKTWKT